MEKRARSAIASGVILVVVGVALLVARLVPGVFGTLTWPFLVIGVGVLFLVLAAATGTEGATGEAPAAVEGAAETGERASRGRRRGRGRDRAREEDDSVVAAEAAAVDTAGPAWAAAAVPADEAAQAMLTPVVAPEPVAALPARSQALPVTPPPAAQPIRIEAYDLPTDDLRALARSAGLEWVLSDAEKIRAVQAAMAAEPAPVRVPREPRRQVLVDEGPLVLVETKKDLSQLKLPFEQNAG